MAPLSQEPTNTDILEAINAFSSKVDEQFSKINALMVTKEYLDEKMADLRGDIVVVIRKEDTKLRTLIEILQEKQVLDEPDVKRILSLEPFPQLFV